MPLLINLDMMPDVEKYFQKKLNVYKLLEMVPRYLSLGHYGEDIHLYVCKNHLRLVLDFEKVCRQFTFEFYYKMCEHTRGIEIRKCPLVGKSLVT